MKSNCVTRPVGYLTVSLAAGLIGSPVLPTRRDALAARQPVSRAVAADAGRALPLFRNSHCTAMARLAEDHGVRKPNESMKALIATCWIYAQYCACDEEGDPILWRIGHGLKKLFSARGYANTAIGERCRHSRNPEETCSWDDYVSAIEDDSPVIVTFCYHPAAANGLTQAKRRESKCFSALGIGYVNAKGRKLLLCQDGIMDDRKCDASVDRVPPSTVGLEAEGMPWSEPGTSLYAWDGEYTNLVMVFVGKPLG